MSSSSTSVPRALVTGATSGIGRATALRLARDGFSVIVHGRDIERGAKVVAEIAAAGGHARFIAAELGNLAEVAGLAKGAGDVDVLVNNSGFAWLGPTTDLAPDMFDKLFATNVRAPYYLVAALAPGMAARGHGRIITIGSMVGAIGMPGSAAYSATRGAIAAMTRSWAAEFSPRGVLVNTVAPGPVATGGAPARAANLEVQGKTTLLERTATADEIAATVAFLASPGATYITGATLAVDGGRSAI